MFSYLSPYDVTPLNDEAMLRIEVLLCYHVRRRSRDTTRRACRQAVILLSPSGPSVFWGLGVHAPRPVPSLHASLFDTLQLLSRTLSHHNPPFLSFLLLFLHLSFLSLSIEPSAI